MDLLILGGTRFLGRHLAEQALAAGHHVTLLHRGRSGPQLFPQAEHLIADRDGDLAAALGNGTWDTVFDTSAYFPRQVRSAAAALSRRVGQYQLVSTISVYAGFDHAPTGEDAPRQVLDDPAVETVTGATYGGLKALCEDAAWAGFGERCLVSRPGLLVGPHDPTGRYTWWLQRLARAAPGSEVLAPGEPGSEVQCIDARDAARLAPAAGGPGQHRRLQPHRSGRTHDDGAFLESARTLLAPQARLAWVPEDFLLERGVAPWMELPLWLSRADAGLHQVDITRALATGLHCRPMAQTITDTAAWAATATPAPVPAGGLPRPPVGLAPEREAALLAEWRTLQNG